MKNWVYVVFLCFVWFLILPFPFAQTNALGSNLGQHHLFSSWLWFGGVHLIQGTSGGAYGVRYVYHHSWSLPLFLLVSIILGVISAIGLNKLSNKLKT